MAYEMKALRTFDGLEGFKKPGEKLEVVSKNRAEALYKAGYAEYVGDQGQDENGVITPSKLELLEEAKTHAELDDLVREFGLSDIPTKDDGATMAQRKQAMQAALA